MDIIHNFEKACGRKFPYEVTARRPGDIAECYADCPKQKELGWEAQYTLSDMCEDSWRWQKTILMVMKTKSCNFLKAGYKKR